MKVLARLGEESERAGRKLTPLAAVRAVASIMCMGKDGFSEAAPEVEIAAALEGFDITDAGPDYLGEVYEAALAESPFRKKRGAFYTPRDVVKFTTGRTLGPILRGRPPVVFDPAAGCGAFLLEAGRALAGFVPVEKLPGLLFGMDVDEGAVETARMSLAIEFDIAPEKWVGLVCGDLFKLGAAKKLLPSGTCDALLGNPPFLNVKRAHLADMADDIAARFRTARGQWDGFAVFMELGLSLLRPGGRFGVVLPKPVLTSANYEPLRQLILAEHSLDTIAPAGKAFPGAGVEAVVLGGSAGSAGEGEVGVFDLERNFQKTGSTRTGVFAELPYRGFSYLAGAKAAAACRAARKRTLVRLGDLFDFKRGVELGKRSKRVHAEASPGLVRLASGADVKPFHCAPSLWLAPGEDAKVFKNPGLYEREEKLLVRRVAKELVASVDRSGAWALNTLYVAVPERSRNLDAWCALLNSAPARRLFRELFCHDDSIFPYIRAGQLARLPVPRDLPEELGDLGRLASKGKGDVIERIDFLVERLYRADRK